MRLTVFTISFILSLCLTWVMRQVALKHQIIDHPSSRKMQEKPIPYLGGLGILISFLGSFTFSYYVLGLANEFNFSILIIPLTLTFFIALLGLIDDLRALNYKMKFLIQCITSVIAGIATSLSDFRAFSFSSNVVNILMTAIWLIFLMNAVNFFDNMDGLLSGTLIISLFAYYIHTSRLDQNLLVAVCISFIGCIAGFLLFNFPEAKIYLGDTGSLFLGFTLGLIVIQIDFRSQPALDASVTLLLPISVILFDAILVVCFRLLRRIHPASPGKDHLSHRLMLSGKSKRVAVVEIWGITLFGSMMSIIFDKSLPYILGASLVVFTRILLVYFKTQSLFIKQTNIYGK